VRVRLIRVAGANLNLFEFDYDLTWAAFFLNANEQIYGRFGGRDASSADSRNSLPGLRYAMTAALETHQKNAEPKPPRTEKVQRVEDYAGGRRARGCIHCHQVWEYRRDSMMAAGTWNRDDIWVYPLPENIGVTLDKNRGDSIKSVKSSSPAEKVGIRTGDRMRTLNGYSVASFADVQYALHKAPRSGEIPVTWEHDGKALEAKLRVSEGWRKTNLTWRTSMLSMLPSISLTGDDLTPAQKKAIGLDEKRLAFKQEQFVHREAKAAGIQPGDIIIGVNDLVQNVAMLEFFGYVRQNFLVGDKITINVIRNGKRIDLPMTLK
jgi:serine protease Do